MTNPVSSGVTALGARPAPPAAGNSAQADELRQAAQAFEAIFIRQMLSAARGADFGGEQALLGGPGIEQFTAMRDDHFAEIASQRGTFGMAAMIERQLAGQLRQQGD
ncbi:rod-binding protein [Altererythrobacter lauratis]|uniref:Rod-binding protein n=1 Tax=Alteraurantiacibacter lauratis TaxID=2054627 RepID=A0ABV7EE98_9SPHN